MKRNTQPVTPELASNNRLLFFPETEEEAAFIQVKLLEMGYVWADGSKIVAHQKGCVAEGMVLKDGKLYKQPKPESLGMGLLCTAEQLDPSYIRTSASILKMFNDLTAKVDAIYEQVMPQTINKGPKLKR